MRFGLFLTIFLTFSTASAAAPTCASIFSLSSVARTRAAEQSFQTKVDHLAKRLETFKGWNVNAREERSVVYKGHPGEPVATLSRLREYGSELDLKIFETVLDVCDHAGTELLSKATPYLPTKRFFRTNRPASSLFKPEHFDWEYIKNYFFSSPSSLTHTKMRDLQYLTHLSTEAKSTSRRRSMVEILRTADRSWHERELEKHPELWRDYKGWKGDNSYSTSFKKLAREMREWSISRTRIDLLHEPLYQLRYGLSTFDLYIASKYFALMRRQGFEIPDTDKKMQLSSWEALQGPVGNGSLEYLVDFLKANSHDSAKKVYLARVLGQMESAPRAGSFAETYRRAWGKVGATAPDHPAPEMYRTDLHIFTTTGSVGFDGVVGEKRTPGLIFNPEASHVVVRWNEKLGRVESSVVNSAAIENENVTMIDAMPELLPLVKPYFDELRGQKSTLTKEQVDAQEDREFRAKVTRTTFFIVTERGKMAPENLVALSRIFYGGPRSLGWTQNWRPVKVGGEKTYIELDFPSYVPPERAAGIPIYEMGRLLTTAKAAPNSRFGMVQFMADYLQNTGAKGTAYMDGKRATTMMYQAMGARIAAEPAELNLPANYKPVWVLSVPVTQMKLDYAPTTFESIRIREDMRTEN